MTVPAVSTQSGLSGALGVTGQTIPLPGSLVNNNLLVGFLQLTGTPTTNPYYLKASLSSLTGSASAVSFVPTLVSSGASDLVIAWCSVYGNRTINFSGAGWQLGDSISAAGLSSIWIYHQGGGSIAAPTFSWTTNAAVHGRTVLVKDVGLSAQIGSFTKNNGSSNNPNCQAINTTYANSTIFSILTCAGLESWPIPTNYKLSGNFSDSTGSNVEVFERVTPSGGSSDAISVTLGSSRDWSIFTVEVQQRHPYEWVLGDLVSAAASAVWFWRYVDSYVAAPVLTWLPAITEHHQMVQFSGVDPVTPIGRSIGASGTGTTLAADALGGIGVKDSLFFGILLLTGNQLISVPANYTNIAQFNDGFGSDRLCYETKAGANPTSDSISVAISSANWTAQVVEIMSQAAIVPQASGIVRGQLGQSNLNFNRSNRLIG